MERGNELVGISFEFGSQYFRNDFINDIIETCGSKMMNKRRIVHYINKGNEGPV